MLPAKNRLKLSKNKEIWSKQRIENDEIQLVVSPKENTFKVATVVSKKVAPRAVDRNRIKRLVAEAVRDQNLQPQIIVIVKKNIAGLKKNQVQAKLTGMLRKLK